MDAVKRAGVNVWFANRSVTKLWNGERNDHELIRFGGWYWHQIVKGRVISTDEEGPFKSRSAAMRDAYLKLQLRFKPWERGTRA